MAKFLSQDEVLNRAIGRLCRQNCAGGTTGGDALQQRSSAASVNAALTGFASEYGFAVQIDRTAPVAAQASTVFAAMNPQLGRLQSADEFDGRKASDKPQVWRRWPARSSSEAPSARCRGTAMLLDLRSIAFPDTQFRASFAQPLPAFGGQPMRSAGSFASSHRVAYIWASRIPNISAPAIHIGDADFVPSSQKTAASGGSARIGLEVPGSRPAMDAGRRPTRRCLFRW